ncbi:type II secretion system protein [Candidatus Nomurabacteria bacterium]|nr:type II secretion system protein [Candidatus Nomurabacteria bacterium]
MKNYISKNKDSKKKGFTLIEMLVSVAIFSIVLLVALGAILTIIDANRKAQTLTSVMNNLNFAFDSITRTIKTGVDPEISSDIITVDAIDLTQNDFVRRKISFTRDEDEDGNGRIVRQIDGGEYVPITAPEVNITKLSFDLIGASDPPSDVTGPFDQPRTLVSVEGIVTIGQGIESTFQIQTTISQRRLNIAGEEAPEI